ncbi:hypothetical protein [Photorhabdus antumapuensis]|nr:hypothetical protein [Photorhabdus antumapuensis]MCA6222693.1 hypothetical protein [Photorhabdus antumapuensis]
MANRLSGIHSLAQPKSLDTPEILLASHFKLAIGVFKDRARTEPFAFFKV